MPRLEYAYLFQSREPFAPVRFVQVVLLHVVDDLGEVVLRRVPAADAVVRAEVALNLVAVRRRRIPLKLYIY